MSSFLSLPQRARHRIYFEAGLLLNSSIDLNRPISERRWPDCRYSYTYNLLLTCRSVYAEVSALLYSTNRFFIRYKDAGSLKALMNLSPALLSCLTHLEIYLNIISCGSHHGRYTICCYGRDTIRRHLYGHAGYHICPEHDKPLGTSLQDNAVLRDWQNAACYIAHHIQSFTLKLYFVCDVENLETGQLAVQPLQNFSSLADCSVRLDYFHHPHLRDLAIEAATRAKGWELPPKTPFRFLDLPRELRLQILEYTDLVTPIREVEWNPKDNFYLHDACTECDGRQDDSRHHACHFRECCPLYSDNTGCFCSRYHTAVSTNCHCWMPPTALFLVCQVLRQDSQVVFFSKNHFIIAPVAGCTHPVESSPDHLEALTFFKDIVPPSAQCFFRSLEVVFPPFHDDYLMLHEPAYQQWLQVIEHMCQLNLPMLSFSVAMADPPVRHVEASNQCRGAMNKDKEEKILLMYLRTLSPLLKLKENGLQAFFVTLASPYSGTLYTHPTDRLGPGVYMNFLQRVKDRYSDYARRIERRVMGEDYDSTLLQNKAHGQSGWLASYILREEEC